MEIIIYLKCRCRYSVVFLFLLTYCSFQERIPLQVWSTSHWGYSSCSCTKQLVLPFQTINCLYWLTQCEPSFRNAHTHLWGRKTSVLDPVLPYIQDVSGLLVRHLEIELAATPSLMDPRHRQPTQKQTNKQTHKQTKLKCVQKLVLVKMFSTVACLVFLPFELCVGTHEVEFFTLPTV